MHLHATSVHMCLTWDVQQLCAISLQSSLKSLGQIRAICIDRQQARTSARSSPTAVLAKQHLQRLLFEEGLNVLNIAGLASHDMNFLFPASK